jgi:hypothetical protein
MELGVGEAEEGLGGAEEREVKRKTREENMTRLKARVSAPRNASMPKVRATVACSWCERESARSCSARRLSMSDCCLMSSDQSSEMW